MTEVKTRRRLNAGQVEVLELLYKFRYGSNNLIAEYFGKKDRSFVYNRLKILQDYGLIGKRFDKSNRIQGKPVAYYLLPDGAKSLMASKPGLTVNIKSIYDDNARSEQFISHCLEVFTISNRLTGTYAKLQFFAKRELSAFDYFPKPLPDGFISYKIGGDIERFFVELFTVEMQPFVVDRRLRQFITYYENDEWAITETPFPFVLCICENRSIEKQLHRQIPRALNRSGTDMFFYTTTLPAINDIHEGEDMIWSAIDEPEKLLSLPKLV